MCVCKGKRWKVKKVENKDGKIRRKTFSSPPSPSVKRTFVFSSSLRYCGRYGIALRSGTV